MLLYYPYITLYVNEMCIISEVFFACDLSWFVSFDLVIKVGF